MNAEIKMNWSGWLFAARYGLFLKCEKKYRASFPLGGYVNFEFCRNGHLQNSGWTRWYWRQCVDDLLLEFVYPVLIAWLLRQSALCCYKKHTCSCWIWIPFNSLWVKETTRFNSKYSHWIGQIVKTNTINYDCRSCMQIHAHGRPRSLAGKWNRS